MSQSSEVIQAALTMLREVLGGDLLETHPAPDAPLVSVQNIDPSPARSFVEHERRGRIGLAMIVRNEESVIGRCLDSVIGLIDTWTVVDTGSTDMTKEIVQKQLGHLPGQLYERPWRNFGANRNELLDLAGGTADYLFLLDADIEVIDEGFDPEQLTVDGYEVTVRGGIDYRMPYIIRSTAPWFYVGSTHEYLSADTALEVEVLSTLVFHHHADGGSRADKFERDRLMLEEDLQLHPDNTRTLFYLAQTRQHLGDAAGALAAYRRRLELGGWEEEIFWSLYQCGRILESVGDWAHAAQTYAWAWEYRPTRAEPLFRLAQGYRSRSMHQFGWMIAEQATTLAVPADRLFVERWIYDWGIDFERSILAWWVGDAGLAVHLTERLLTQSEISPDYWRALEANLTWYRARLPV